MSLGHSEGINQSRRAIGRPADMRKDIKFAEACHRHRTLAGVARELGINVKTAWRKARRLGITTERVIRFPM